MDGSAELPQSTTEINAAAAVVQTPDQKVRRRLIQSTLCPHRSPVKRKTQENCGEKEGVGAAEDGDEEDGECCGSQGRRKRKTIRNTPSTPRKKAARSRKVALDGDMSGGDSPDDGSPQKLKSTRKVLVRNGRRNGPKGTLQEKVPNQPNVSNTTLDLRLEAKMTAEENSRLFAGRQIHPFFSKRMGKKNLDASNPDYKNLNTSSMFNIKEGTINFAPIHVLGSDKNDFGPVDWSKWTFHEESSSLRSCYVDLGTTTSSCNGFINSLGLDDVLKSSNPSGLLASQEDVTLVHCPGGEEVCERVGVSASLADESGEVRELFRSRMLGPEANKIIDTAKVDCLSYDANHQNVSFQERLSKHCSRKNQPEKSLWTDKYQPEKPVEVCGNAEPVKFINEWLRLWHDQDLGNRKPFMDADKLILQENCCSDFDAEYTDDEASLKNVLLVTGPVGSGKSAAVYACAKEQGFEVIEVNSSDWRNGALVKQKFLEAVGLQWLKRTPETTVCSQSKIDLNSTPTLVDNGMEAPEFKNDGIELMSEANEQYSNGDGIPRGSKVDRDHGEIKTLILFEDVEATLSEDLGLMTAISQLARYGRRPIVLTRNSNSPILSDSLSRDEVFFSMPSSEELLLHLNMVCSSEQVNIQSCMIEKFIQYCEGDIRKALLHLQFWCQGKEYLQDRRTCSIYSPLLFDPEAAHGVLPSILPWGLPYQLSEYIEREISKSLCGLEDNRHEDHCLFEMFEEELANVNMQNGLDVPKNGKTTIVVRKEAILSQNSGAADDNDLNILVMDACDSPKSSGSPVVFTRRSAHRYFDTVVSSGSDDEHDNSVDGHPLISERLCKDNSNIVAGADADAQLPFKPAELDGTLNPWNSHFIHLPAIQAQEGLHHQYSTIGNFSQVNDTCQSIDVSCVPESTCVVPETVYNGHELPYGADATEIISPFTLNKVDQSVCGPQESTEPTQLDDVSGYMVNEQMMEFQSELEDSEVGTSKYHVMDECSRVDFCKVSKRVRKKGRRVERRSIQDTWNELRMTNRRDRCEVDPEDACNLIELAYRMSDLISEADLLRHDCAVLLDDSPNQSVDPSEENHGLGGLYQQVHMTSVVAEYGYCYYVNSAASIGSKMGLGEKVDVVREILSRTNDSTAIGKLLRLNRRSQQTSFTEASPRELILPQSGRETCQKIVQSLVPPRLYLAVRGSGFHEYVCSLAQISRSETCRLSENHDVTRRRRRGRMATNYLSTGALDLSPEELSSLTRYSCYGNDSPLKLEGGRCSVEVEPESKGEGMRCLR